MHKLLTFLSIITLVSSCGNKEREDDLATKRIATIEIKKLGDKYKAIQNWDTLDYDYTIQYQELFSDTNKLVLLDDWVIITDIKEENNKNIVVGECGFYPTFYFKLECDKSQINKLINMDISYGSHIGIIAKITDLKKPELELVSEVEYDIEETDENHYETIAYSYLQIEGANDIFLKGKLIDFYVKNSR